MRLPLVRLLRNSLCSSTGYRSWGVGDDLGACAEHPPGRLDIPGDPVMKASQGRPGWPAENIWHQIYEPLLGVVP